MKPRDPVVTAAAARPSEPLDAAGQALVLHPDVGRLLQPTRRQFPHVVNRLAAAWTEPDRLLRTVDAMLLNDRPEHRQDFPIAVVQKLAELRVRYETRLAPVLRQAPRPARPAAAPARPLRAAQPARGPRAERRPQVGRRPKAALLERWRRFVRRLLEPAAHP